MLEAIRRSAESWGVKILFGLIILVFVFWGVGSFRGNRTQVVAFVNEEPILISEFSQTLSRAIEQYRQQNPTASAEDIKALGVKQQVLSQMITQKLLSAEATRLNIGASATEIADKIRSISAFNGENGFDKQRYLAILSSQGITPGQFEQDMRDSIILNKLKTYATLPAQVGEGQARDIFSYAGEQRSINYLQVQSGDLVDSMEVSDEEISKYYDENKESYKQPVRIKLSYISFTPKSLADRIEVPEAEIAAYYEANKGSYKEDMKVKARHILVKVSDKATPEQDNAARKKIEEIIEKVRQGASFTDLAKENSDDPTADNGGELGWIGRGEMVKEFEDAVFGTAPGKLAEPVRTPFGWHAVQIEEIRDAHQKPLEEVHDSIRDALAQDKAADMLTDLLDQGLEQINSGVALSKIAEDLKLKVENTDLFARSQGTGLIGVDDRGLESLFALQQGEVTEMPVSTDQGYMLAEVTERRPAEYDPLDKVREQVVQSVKSKKAMETAKAKADELLAAIGKNELTDEQKAGIKSTAVFNRQGYVPELGLSPSLVQAVFRAKKDQWLDKPYAVGDSYVLAQLKDVENPGDEQWDKDKKDWIAFLAQGAENELYQAYVRNLRDNAKIEIVSPEMLD